MSRERFRVIETKTWQICKWRHKNDMNAFSLCSFHWLAMSRKGLLTSFCFCLFIFHLRNELLKVPSVNVNRQKPVYRILKKMQSAGRHKRYYTWHPQIKTNLWKKKNCCLINSKERYHLEWQNPKRVHTV